MSIPDRIPIEYIPDYYTKNVGSYQGDKQFLGIVEAFIAAEPAGAPWKVRKRWYAVLHKFDNDGNHVETEHYFAGVTADGERDVCERAKSKLMEFMNALGTIVFGNISVRPFQVEIDGEVFGLVAGNYESGESDDESDDDYVELLPCSLVFNPPWTGQYDT